MAVQLVEPPNKSTLTNNKTSSTHIATFKLANCCNNVNSFDLECVSRIFTSDGRFIDEALIINEASRMLDAIYYADRSIEHIDIFSATFSSGSLYL